MAVSLPQSCPCRPPATGRVPTVIPMRLVRSSSLPSLARCVRRPSGRAGARRHGRCRRCPRIAIAHVASRLREPAPLPGPDHRAAWPTALRRLVRMKSRALGPYWPRTRKGEPQVPPGVWRRCRGSTRGLRFARTGPAPLAAGRLPHCTVFFPKNHPPWNSEDACPSASTPGRLSPTS